MAFPARHFTALADGRLRCDVCPRQCCLRDGQQGLCFVRSRDGDQMVLTAYGRSSGFCVDPIEKKPLFHFYPGTPVFSFGTAGCNLLCRFCQNWDISKSREMERLADSALPHEIASVAGRLNCRSVAFTYNDPVIFLEYAVDTAIACHEGGLRTVAVTAGYIAPAARSEFFAHMDAANVDLKSFSPEFYRKNCGAELAPVLDTLLYLRRETSVWLELTTLLIPGENDTDQEIRSMSEWIARELGVDVPLHFSAFHPAFKMVDVSSTPAGTLQRARQIALSEGLRYVYTGNVHDEMGESTLCHGCGATVIGRNWYELTRWALDVREGVGACRQCGTSIAGHFEERPGHWGAQRRPVRMSD